MFSKILIANRGEIACRVIRTARRMGIATVAVYSEADAAGPHVEMADEARLIGPPPAPQSYLNIAAIIDAAAESGAEAIHPGYGFLSENAEFAEACAAAGLVFIGPPPAAIRAMASKSAAKTLMERAGVPVVPGYHGDDQNPVHLLAAAEEIGFPVLIKAVSGGGGRGMRVVSDRAEFAAALAAARREAASAFGDDRVLLEKYVDRPRHIEVQVFADQHGNAVHIFDRDCSIQRRHQKVVEEAPAPGLDKALRCRLAQAALRAARAVGYVGAGTVEFVVPRDGSGRFYFIEMNTRLQVEHPVTEAITGLDLVEWQLQIAAGEPLPLTQSRLGAGGHAIEVRLYAEDPTRGFLPQTGVLRRLHLPSVELARVDTGVREGDAVTPFYDAMIAKIVVCGEDRAAAIARLRRALGVTAVLGLNTNLGFLSRVANHADFAAGAIDTGFIERHRDGLLLPAQPAPIEALAAAALSRLRWRRRSALTATADRFSPWQLGDGWRLSGVAAQEVVLQDGADRRTVEAVAEAAGWRLRIGGREVKANAEATAEDGLMLMLDGIARRVLMLDDGVEMVVSIAGESWPLTEIDALTPAAGEDPAAGKMTAPMPGRVTQVLVGAGAEIRRGEPLMVIEAMKMEHTIVAPADGVVAAVRFGVGDRVEEGAELITLDAAPTDATGTARSGCRSI
jgi:3-methylcrotonyl-CoA carboxylase alpha subunit